MSLTKTTCPYCSDGEIPEIWLERIEAEHARAIASARADERERCASIADEHAQAWGPAMASPAIVIAAAIRASLSNPEPPNEH